MQTGAWAQSTWAQPAPHRQGLWGSSGGLTCSQGITHISQALHSSQPELQVYSCAYFMPLAAGTGTSGGKDIPRRMESSPSGICAWLGFCTGQSFSLCWGCEQYLGTPYPEPTALSEGAPADPFLLMHLSASFLQLLILECAKTGLG